MLWFEPTLRNLGLRPLSVVFVCHERFEDWRQVTRRLDAFTFWLCSLWGASIDTTSFWCFFDVFHHIKITISSDKMLHNFVSLRRCASIIITLFGHLGRGWLLYVLNHRQDILLVFICVKNRRFEAFDVHLRFLRSSLGVWGLLGGAFDLGGWSAG